LRGSLIHSASERVTASSRADARIGMPRRLEYQPMISGF
jgi:hypothetical protein